MKAQKKTKTEVKAEKKTPMFALIKSTSETPAAVGSKTEIQALQTVWEASGVECHIEELKAPTEDEEIAQENKETLMLIQGHDGKAVEMPTDQYLAGKKAMKSIGKNPDKHKFIFFTIDSQDKEDELTDEKKWILEALFGPDFGEKIKLTVFTEDGEPHAELFYLECEKAVLFRGGKK